MSDGGAITGVHGREFVKAVCGLPWNRSVLEGLPGGGVFHTSDNPGSQNLCWFEAASRLLSAVGAAEETTRAAVLMRNNLLAEAQACQGQEAGGYDPTWALVRYGCLRAFYPHRITLNLPITEFAYRAALRYALVNYKGVGAMVGGRASSCGNGPVADVCLALLIGLPVKRAKKWWTNPGSIGALLLAEWLQEHGRDAIMAPETRACLRSWVLHGKSGNLDWNDLKLYDAVEVRRYEDCSIAWTPRGVRSFVRDKPMSLPKIFSCVDDDGPECVMRSAVEASFMGTFMEYGSTSEKLLTSLSWNRERWTITGNGPIVETAEAPLPKIDSAWLPKGEEPVPEPEKEPNWAVAERQLRSAVLVTQRALDQVKLRRSGEAQDLIEGTDHDPETGGPGATDHLRRALAALRGDL